jgi:hypothetical protein
MAFPRDEKIRGAPLILPLSTRHNWNVINVRQNDALDDRGEKS